MSRKIVKRELLIFLIIKKTYKRYLLSIVAKNEITYFTDVYFDALAVFTLNINRFQHRTKDLTIYINVIIFYKCLITVNN